MTQEKSKRHIETKCVKVSIIDMIKEREKKRSLSCLANELEGSLVGDGAKDGRKSKASFGN